MWLITPGQDGKVVASSRELLADIASQVASTSDYHAHCVDIQFDNVNETPVSDAVAMAINLQYCLRDEFAQLQ